MAIGSQAGGPGGLAPRRGTAQKGSMSTSQTTVQDGQRPVAGVLWMVASGLCFVAVTGIVRYLGTDLPAAQGAFLRFAWGVVFLAPTLWTVMRAGIAPGLLPLVAGRGAMHTVAVILWFYAMARIPVAEVTAIGYINPVCVTLGAVLFFGERLARRRVVAVLVAIVGALIVLRPGLRELSDGHFAQLGAAVFFAGSYLFAKRLTQLMDAGAVVALMSDQPTSEKTTLRHSIGSCAAAMPAVASEATSPAARAAEVRRNVIFIS